MNTTLASSSQQPLQLGADAAAARAKDPDLAKFDGRVSDSGEGRWTIKAAIDEGVRTPVLSAPLYSRFNSRGEAEFADKLLSAMRFEFGGHEEKPADKSPDADQTAGIEGPRDQPCKAAISGQQTLPW